MNQMKQIRKYSINRDINLSKSDTVNSMKELVKSPDVDTPTLSKSNPLMNFHN